MTERVTAETRAEWRAHAIASIQNRADPTPRQTILLLLADLDDAHKRIAGMVTIEHADHMLCCCENRLQEATSRLSELEAENARLKAELQTTEREYENGAENAQEPITDLNCRNESEHSAYLREFKRANDAVTRCAMLSEKLSETESRLIWAQEQIDLLEKFGAKAPLDHSKLSHCHDCGAAEPYWNNNFATDDHTKFVDEALARISTLESDLANSREENERLREAIKPFLPTSDEISRMLWSALEDDAPAHMTVKLGDIRRAQDAYSERRRALDKPKGEANASDHTA